MPFDIAAQKQDTFSGRAAYEDGLAAESSVLNEYLALGYRLVQQRWRGRCGEIDLIFKGSDTYVFVEVKKARTTDIALSRLTERQLWRIARSAEDFIGTMTENPLMPMRLDLAAVDGVGQVSVLENLTLY